MTSSIDNLFTKDEIIFEDDDNFNAFSNQETLTAQNCSPTAGIKRNKELEDKIRHQEFLIKENEIQCTNLFSQLEHVQDDNLSLKLKNKLLEKNLIVLRQERDEINSALYDGKQEIARLLKVEKEKQILLHEMNIMLKKLQSQDSEMKSLQNTVNGLQRELFVNAKSFSEKEISYVDEVATCRDTIFHLEKQLLDSLESNVRLEQPSLELTRQIGVENVLLNSSTVALCVQISAMLITYSATKFNVHTRHTTFKSEKPVSTWIDECDEAEINDTLSKEEWKAENLASELSKTNFWCPVSEEPQLTSSVIENTIALNSWHGIIYDLLHSGKCYRNFLMLILLAILWVLMDFPVFEFSMRLGKLYVGLGRR